MTTPHFTHLHVHTEYSLLDGAIDLEQLVNHAKKEGLKALASLKTPILRTILTCVFLPFLTLFVPYFTRA